MIDVPWKRRRGSPKRKWLDNFRNHLSERELLGDGKQYRINWKRLIRNIDGIHTEQKASSDESRRQ